MSGKIYTTAIILAAGLGTRMRSEITKQQMKICGRSVLYRSAFAFEHAELVVLAVIVCVLSAANFITGLLGLSFQTQMLVQALLAWVYFDC